MTLFLVCIALMCFAAASYYPIHYRVEMRTNERELDELREIRRMAERNFSKTDNAQGLKEPILFTTTDEKEQKDTNQSSAESLPGTDEYMSAQFDAYSDSNNGSAPLPEYLKKPRTLDEARILPQYRELYAMNHDMVGWLTIEGTPIDYPVMQTPEDNEYYLHRDFQGKRNSNGQLILDKICDPYTPSYNLIIFGHNMKSGKMFGKLSRFQNAQFWQSHKLVQFDSLMEERQYVVVASFYSAQFDDSEPGFRYATAFQDQEQYDDWMGQVKEAQCFETGIDCRFGDEFLTLSTCAYHRKNGRFVVVARRIRQDEVFENVSAP